MSPLSGPVLAGATLVASPALWAALIDQTMPLDVALTRYLVAVFLCWAVLSLIAEFVLPDPTSVKRQAVEITPETPADNADETRGAQ